MSSIRAHDGVCIGVPKSCFRCGGDFIDFSDRGAARVCADCKKPRVPAPQPSLALLGQPLTHRQVQIADLIARGGMTNKNIAHELHLNEGTIKVFVSIVLAKTGQPNRTALAVWWALAHR
jgi:DNA-binding NarL/FixJ family response regulator